MRKIKWIFYDANRHAVGTGDEKKNMKLSAVRKENVICIIEGFEMKKGRGGGVGEFETKYIAVMGETNWKRRRHNDEIIKCD